MNEYYDVDEVIIPEKENVDKNKKEPNKVVRDIQSVSDYLRVITNILSDRYIIELWHVEISHFENLFTNPEGMPLKDLLRRGIFFRGESKKFKYQIPGLYRSVEFMEHEKELIDENIANSAAELENKPLFDKLTLMQHYGSATRILDITSNALIALYFAVSDGEPKKKYKIETNNVKSVSNDIESNGKDDGFVYLLSGYEGKNDKNNVEIKTPDSEEVIVKSVISRLSFKYKNILSYLFHNQITDNTDIKIAFKKKSRNKKYNINALNVTKKAIQQLYLLVEEELKISNVVIPVSYLFGYNIVRPYQIDHRVERQSSLFMIFGLQNLYGAKKAWEEAINNDDDLIGLQQEEKEAKESLDTKIGGKLDTAEHEIEVRKKDIFKKTYEDIIQGEISDQIYNLGIMYSIGGEGIARIRIKEEYKKQILDELNMLGINGGTVYPDMTNRIKYIKQKYDYLELDPDSLI